MRPMSSVAILGIFLIAQRLPIRPEVLLPSFRHPCTLFGVQSVVARCCNIDKQLRKTTSRGREWAAETQPSRSQVKDLSGTTSTICRTASADRRSQCAFEGI